MLVFERKGGALIPIGFFNPEKMIHLGDRVFIALKLDPERHATLNRPFEVHAIERPGIDERGYPIKAVILESGQNATLLPGWQPRLDWARKALDRLSRTSPTA